MNLLVKRDSDMQLGLEKEKQQFNELYNQLKNISGRIDVTLQRHAEALQAKALQKIDGLEKKMLKAEKRKFEVQQQQLHKMKQQLFSNNSLQERVENFMLYYAKEGSGFIESLYKNSLGLEQEFTVLSLKD